MKIIKFLDQKVFFAENFYLSRETPGDIKLNQNFSNSLVINQMKIILN